MKLFSKLPAMTGGAAQQAQEDMALIARGEELDLPWRRLRVLIDHGLVEITTSVILGGPLAGSRTSIAWTSEGTRFMGQEASLGKRAMKSIFAGNFDPDKAIEAAVDLYGVDATTAVAYCALDAWTDRREADYEFWFGIFARLKGIPLSNSRH